MLSAANVMSETAEKVLIVGLGASGQSVARFLAARGVPFAVADSREAPPALSAFEKDFPGTELHLGAFDEALFAQYPQRSLRPRLPPHEEQAP